MTLGTSLNLLWVLLGVGSFSALAASEYARPRQARWARVLAVWLALFCLFPCVSATDDQLSLDNIPFAPPTRGSLGTPAQDGSQQERPGLHLEHFFESLQTLQPAAVFSLLLALTVLAFVATARRERSEQRALTVAGRAPPRISSY